MSSPSSSTQPVRNPSQEISFEALSGEIRAQVIHFLDPLSIQRFLRVKKEWQADTLSNLQIDLKSTLTSFIRILVSSLGEEEQQVKENLSKIMLSLQYRQSSLDLTSFKKNLIASIKSEIIGCLSSLNKKALLSLEESLKTKKIPLPVNCDDIFWIASGTIDALNLSHPSTIRAAYFTSLSDNLFTTDQMVLALQLLDLSFKQKMSASHTHLRTFNGPLRNICPDALLKGTHAEYLLRFRDQIAEKLIISTDRVLESILNQIEQHPFNRSLRRKMLAVAITDNQPEKVLLLIRKAKHPQKVGLLALHLAAAAGNLPLVQTLVERTRPSDPNKIAALATAVHAKQEGISLLLLGQIQGDIPKRSQHKILKESVDGLLENFSLAFAEKYPLNQETFDTAAYGNNSASPKKQLLNRLKKKADVQSMHELLMPFEEAIQTRDSAKLQDFLRKLKTENLNLQDVLKKSPIFKDFQLDSREITDYQLLLHILCQDPGWVHMLPPTEWSCCQNKWSENIWSFFYQVFPDLLSSQERQTLDILRSIVSQSHLAPHIIYLCQQGFRGNQHTALHQTIPEYPRLIRLLENLSSLDAIDFIGDEKTPPELVGIALGIAVKENNSKAALLLLQDKRIPQHYLDAALRFASSSEMLYILLPNRSFSEAALENALTNICETSHTVTRHLLSLFFEAGPISQSVLDDLFRELIEYIANENQFSQSDDFLERWKVSNLTGTLKNHAHRIHTTVRAYLHTLMDYIEANSENPHIAATRITQLAHEYEYPLSDFLTMCLNASEDSQIPLFQACLPQLTELKPELLTHWIRQLVKHPGTEEDTFSLLKKLSLIESLLIIHQRGLEAQKALEASALDKPQEEAIPAKRARIEPLELPELISLEALGEIIRSSINYQELFMESPIDERLTLLDYLVF